jgi:Helix-turn-helix domain
VNNFTKATDMEQQFASILESIIRPIVVSAVMDSLDGLRLNYPLAPTEQPDRWLDVNQLSAYLPDNPKTETIYEKARSGEYPAHKKGKKWYFLTSEINQYLKTGRKKTKAEQMDDLRIDAEKQLEAMRSKAKK